MANRRKTGGRRPPKEGEATRWKKGESGNPKGRPPLPLELREYGRALCPSVIDAWHHLALTAEDQGLRFRIQERFLEKFFGRKWPDEILRPRLEQSAGTDLASEIVSARENHATLQALIEDQGDEAPPSLFRAESEAAELVRRLVATQKDVNPGGDKSGDYRLAVELAELPPGTSAPAPEQQGPSESEPAADPLPPEKLEGFE